MTPNPVAPAPGAPTADPVVELVRTQRQSVGYGLIVLALVFLVGAVMFGLTASRLSANPEAAKTEQEKDSEDPLKQLQKGSETKALPNPTNYIFAAIGMGLAFFVAGGGGAFLVVSFPKPTEAEQRSEARIVILAVGGLLGAVLLVFAAVYFYLWSDSLVAWLDKGEGKQAPRGLYPLFMVLVGGGSIFLATFPARGEERNNPVVRRFVYGANLALTTLLLLVLLVIINVALGPRIPNRLDTTGTGFYTLSPPLRQLIEGLDQPIHAYAILQEGDLVADDTKRLLLSCQEVNPGKFRVTVLSPAMNKKDIDKLRADYPLIEREGILLVAGEEGGERKRSSFLRLDEMAENKTGPQGQSTPVFNGEPKLLRELMFLAENKQKPKVYFTQSSGELAITPSARGMSQDPRRTANSLRAYLEKNYFDVQPLTFEPVGVAKVPDDAAVVVVADPVATLPANGVEAIRKYMSDPRPDGKKGKLIVLAGAQAGPGGKALPLGLEPVLATFGVTLSDKFMYCQPSSQLERLDNESGTRVTIARVTKDAVEAQNPVAISFNATPLPLLDCRALSSTPNPQSVLVFVSQPGRTTWMEPVQVRHPAQAWEELSDRAEKIMGGAGSMDQKRAQLAELLRPYNISPSPRELGIYVSERGTSDRGVARVAVIGCGWFVSDDASVRVAGSGGRTETVWLDLMGSTLDWIRDRPTVTGVTEKPYTTYTLKPGYNHSRMVWVPLLLANLLVFAMGAGVWVVRRK